MSAPTIQGKFLDESQKVFEFQDGSRYKKISSGESSTGKKVLKGLAIAGAAMVAVAAAVVLVVGVIFLLNPLGFGVGNAIGAGVTAAGGAIAAAALKVAAFAGANALYITIAGAAGLGAAGVGSAIFVIIKRLKNKPKKQELTPDEQAKLRLYEQAKLRLNEFVFLNKYAGKMLTDEMRKEFEQFRDDLLAADGADKYTINAAFDDVWNELKGKEPLEEITDEDSKE